MPATHMSHFDCLCRTRPGAKALPNSGFCSSNKARVPEPSKRDRPAANRWIRPSSTVAPTPRQRVDAGAAIRGVAAHQFTPARQHASP